MLAIARTEQAPHFSPVSLVDYTVPPHVMGTILYQAPGAI
jgi:hypothetical protein